MGIAPGGQNEAASTSIASGARILAAGLGRLGGAIETSGRTLSLGAATIDAGAGGSWVLDPTELTIDAAAASAIDSSLDARSNVTQQTSGGAGSGAGDIDVDAAISWDSSATLTLSAFHSVNVNAAITATGNGTLDIVTDNNVGGASSGGSFTIATGTGGIQFTTPNEGALTVNGNPYTLIWTVPELQGVGSSGDYALATNLDAAGFSGFTPIDETTAFAGTFNGLGNKIRNLTIDSTDPYVGVFGQIGSGGMVENIGLVGGAVSGAYEDYATSIAQLAGLNDGAINNAYATGGVSGGYSVGGLVGENNG